MKRRNLWQTPSRWANGQTNKLAAPLPRQPLLPPPTLTPPDPPGPPMVALTVSSLKVQEVVGLLSLTSFTVFDSRLAIQASLPLICKYQHAAPEPWFVFLALLFPSVCACRLLELQVFIQRNVKLSQVFVPVGSGGRVHTRSRSQTCYPKGSFFFFSFILGFPSCFLSWIQEEEREHLQEQVLKKLILRL